MIRQRLLFILALVVTTSAAYAQPAARQPMLGKVDAAVFNGLRYRLVGPSRGGRVTTVTGVPSQP